MLSIRLPLVLCSYLGSYPMKILYTELLRSPRTMPCDKCGKPARKLAILEGKILKEVAIAMCAKCLKKQK